MLNCGFCRREPGRAFLFLASAASAGFLVLALIGQYGFNLHPCELCLAQRVPYGVIALFGLAAGLYMTSAKKINAAIVACGVLFALDAGIAIYHSGVEAGIFKGPSGCTNADKPGQTLEEMRAAIMNAQLVPCDQPMIHILGLSMASWNAIAASLMAAVMFYAYVHMHRRMRSGL